MRKGTKIVIILLVAGVFLLVSASFPQTGLSERALAVGLGVDYDSDAKTYEATIEIIVAEGSSEEQQSSNQNEKCLSGVGPTVSLAFRNLYDTFGKIPSFGECNIILLGEECIKNTTLNETLDFFFLSDAFKDGMVIAACQGKAKDIFNKKSPMDDYISFALTDLLAVGGKKAQIPHSTLCEIMRSQKTKSKSGYLNYVKFEEYPPDQQTDGAQSAASQQKSGKFVVEQLAVFSDNALKGFLNKKEISGLNLCGGAKVFTTFFLGGQDMQSALGVVSKKGAAKAELNNDVVTLRVKLKLKIEELRTDTTGEILPFQPKERKDITEMQKQGAKTAAKEYIEAAFDKSIALDCDFLNIKKKLYASFGKQYEEFENRHRDDFWDKVFLVVEISIVD